MDFKGGVGFGGGVGIDAIGLAIAFVLGADGAGADGFDLGCGDGAEDFYFFVVDGLGSEVGGRLHGGDGEKLHHVVLHHIPHGSDFIVEGASGADPFLFGDGDLNIVDQVTVPNRLPNGVGEAKVEEILNGFFAEVVVDTKEVGFVEAGLEIGHELAGGGEVVTERFFDDDPTFEALADESSGGELLDDGGKIVGSGSEIEDVLGQAAGFG